MLQLAGDQLEGAAVLWAWLRSFVTVAAREQYSRADVLILLNGFARDASIAPAGEIERIADAWEASTR